MLPTTMAYRLVLGLKFKLTTIYGFFSPDLPSMRHCLPLSQSTTLSSSILPYRYTPCFLPSLPSTHNAFYAIQLMSFIRRIIV